MTRKIALLLLTLLCPLTALAASKVAILPIEATEIENAGRQVRAALRAAVEALPGQESVDEVGMTLEEARVSFSCFDEGEACMAQVGAIFQADRLLWGHLERVAGLWSLKLSLLDVKAAKLLRTDTVRFPDSDETIDRLQEAAGAFVRGEPLTASALTTLRVLSRPAGADLLFDGEPSGRTPVTLQASVGTHLIELRLAGRAPLRQAVSVAGREQRLELDLESGAAKVSDEELGAGFWLGVSFGALAVVSAGTGAMTGLHVLDLSDQAKTETNPEERKRLEDDFNQMQLLSNISWGVAGAAALTSAYFFLFDDDASVALVPSADGVGLAGRF